MKTNTAPAFPEACKATGQGEKSCPVCQAWGGIPSPGSGFASGTGPGIAVLESRLGPGVVPEPALSLHPIPGPAAGSGAVAVPGSQHGAISEPASAPRGGPGPGPGLKPEPRAWSASGLGAGSLPGPGPRRGSGTGLQPSELPTAPTSPSQQKTQVRTVLAPKQKVLVTGGGGYLGFSLGSTLAKGGTSVILLDLRRPQWELPPGTEFIQADIRDEEALYRAFEGVDCVFHVASYGMSGAEKLQKEQIESINVGGTKLVIDVCVRQRVPRLVYTSTVNVAFGGKPIEQGDEDSVPYFPLDKHMDHYSRTKAIADQLILMANGTPLPGDPELKISRRLFMVKLTRYLPRRSAASVTRGGGTLRTCVLRPPGIYGPEEQRHLPRVASHIKRRLFVFRFGDRKTRMNWVHVCNLVQAHVLAAEALTAAKGFVASGQAYYINDGESVNVFEWMAPLFEKLGRRQPWIQVPTSWVYLTATVMEFLHLALRPICSIAPLLTRSEVHSVAVTHTFQIAKARAQLGYAPDKFNFADAVELYVQSTSRRPRGSPARTLVRWLLGLLLLLGLLALILRFLDLQPLQATEERL